MEREKKRGGQMGRFELLRCRVQHFVDGMVSGSEEFVNEMFEARRELFGPNRKDGARKIRGADGAGIWTMRDLGRPEGDSGKG